MRPEPLPIGVRSGLSARRSAWSWFGRRQDQFIITPTLGNSFNTGTTIVTFLMVFLIQNTQNRDARAINLKLNELIHSIDKAKNQMIDIENLSDVDLDELSARYEKTRSECHKTAGQETYREVSIHVDDCPTKERTSRRITLDLSSRLSHFALAICLQAEARGREV